MRTFERTLLVVTLVIAVVALLTGRGQQLVSTAMAQSSADADGATAEDDAMMDPDSEHTSIAYVAGYSVITDLLASERFQPAVDELQAEAEEALAPFEERAQELQQEARNIDPNDAQARSEIQQRFRELQQEAQQVQQEYQQRIEELQRTNVQIAYNDLRATVEAIADDGGFDYVLMAENPDEDLAEGLTQDPGEEIRRRHLIVHPEGANITADVRADLNLD
jgi:Skp family chaperone for outer membrane proteins